MSLTSLTLTTNKSIATIEDNTRVLSQDERGLVQRFILINAEGSPYDLTNYRVQFNEQKLGNQAVIDDENFTVVDAKNGTVDYKLNKEVYSESGTCFLAIISNAGDIVDCTKDFNYKVKKAATISYTNGTYISSMYAQLASMKSLVKKADDALTANLAKSDGQVNDFLQQQKNKLAETTQALTNYTNQYQTLQQNWQNEVNAINEAAKSQMQSIQNDYDQTKNANQNAINSSIDNANKRYQKQLDDLQSDYNVWKTKTLVDFNNSLSDLNKKIADNNQQMDSLSKTAADTLKKVQDAETLFNSINFAQYVKIADFNNLQNRVTALENAGYTKYREGFSSAEEARKWSAENRGQFAYFDDGN